MIKKLNIINFKCFEKLETELRNVNILSGLNGMGKSTIIQSILLAKQSFDSKTNGLLLNGDLISLGKGQDILFEKAKKDSNIEIELEGSAGDIADYTVDFVENADVLYNVKDIKSAMNFKLIYLSALRIVPKSYYNMESQERLENKEFGNNGEYAIQFLKKNLQTSILNKEILIGDRNNDYLGYQTNMWLDYISPGANFRIATYDSIDLSELKFEFVEGKYRTNEYKNINVGFGLTYILPIIVVLLTATEGDLVIIENPEAHLHPAGQRKIGELIAKASGGGAQIMVETHSDHLLNGVRLSVRNNEVNKDKIKIMYFYKDAKDDYKHKFCCPNIMSNGKIDNWPEGFFDEWEKVLLEFF